MMERIKFEEGMDCGGTCMVGRVDSSSKCRTYHQHLQHAAPPPDCNIIKTVFGLRIVATITHSECFESAMGDSIDLLVMEIVVIYLENQFRSNSELSVASDHLIRDSIHINSCNGINSKTSNCLRESKPHTARRVCLRRYITFFRRSIAYPIPLNTSSTDKPSEEIDLTVFSLFAFISYNLVLEDSSSLKRRSRFVFL